MAEQIRVSAVMPCLNEAATIEICIRRAQSGFQNLGIVGEVIVADNGSVDDSAAIAEQLGARVVRVAKRGYGAALMAGIMAARGDIVVMADADDSYDWLEMGPFIAKVQEGNDLVIGNRFLGGIRQGAMPALHRYLGNPVLSAVARAVSGVPIGDFHCGMRAFRRSAFEKMALSTSGMEFATEMIMNAARSGLRIAEIPTVLHPDKRNRAPHLRSFRDGWRHLRFILTYAPNHVLLLPAGIFLPVGVPLMALLAAGPAKIFGWYLGPHFLALGLVLTLTGCSALSFATLAKVIVARKHSQLDDWLVVRARSRYAMEVVLLAGIILMLLGIGADSYILYKWLTNYGMPMEHTIHPAMVATGLIAIGANAVLWAFLLNLLVAETSTRELSRAE